MPALTQQYRAFVPSEAALQGIEVVDMEEWCLNKRKGGNGKHIVGNYNR